MTTDNMSRKDILDDISRYDVLIDAGDKRINKLRDQLENAVYAQEARREHVRALTKRLMVLDSLGTGEE